LSLLGSVVLSGCASRAEIKRFQAQVDSLSVAGQQQAESLTRLDSLMLENIRTMRTLRAETNAFMGAIQEELSIIESIMRDSGFKVSALTTRIDALKDDIDKRATAPSDSAVEDIPVKGAEIFATALLDLNQGKYELAIMGFESYLEEFEDGAHAPEARYNIGEALFAQANYSEAALSYLTITRKWPASGIVPSALYKAGQCYERLDQPEMAANFYRRLVAEFSSTAEAEHAKRRLEEIEE